MIDQVTIRATVTAIRHRKDDGWTALSVRSSEQSEEFSATGTTANTPAIGLDVQLVGKWEHHPKWGTQFKFAANCMTICEPTTEDQIKRRLQSYPGLGESSVARILAHFAKVFDGAITWEVVDTTITERPEALLAVKGIGKKGLDKITRHHALQNGPVAKIAGRLLELGAPAWLADPIHDEFKDEGLELLDRNPFQVSARVSGFGFKLADRIATMNGLDPNSEERVIAGIMHELRAAQVEGHCGLPTADLEDSARGLLGFQSTELVYAQIMAMTKARALAFAHSLVFTARMDRMEDAVAHKISELATVNHAPLVIGSIQEDLSDGQRAAVETYAKRGLMVVTGGPGTGKTTVVKTIVRVALANGERVTLCSPTGRAAKRLEEATGEDASTIHRTLKFQPGGVPAHGPEDPLPIGTVIVDESSMLDLWLAAGLLAALTPQHRLILVGDSDQLPSVGAGNVLRDIIASESVPVIRLSQVFRQAQGSSIISNAHRILAGDALISDPAKTDPPGEFFVLPVRSPDAGKGRVIQMAADRIPAAYGLDPRTEVQILIPMKKWGEIDSVNAQLQRRYSPDGPEFRFGDRVFRRGDRVIQIRNNYDLGIFNGDLGQVTEASDGILIVDFGDGRIVAFEALDAKDLRLAYAMTIHKSQGSEFPAVIVLVLERHSRMLVRNLIYTAVTRAKRLCVVVGEPSAIARAIGTADAAKRHTGLEGRLRELVRE